MQGDIIERCPVFRPPVDLPWPLPDGDALTPEFEASVQDVIILSQSCDLAPNQKSDMWLVLLCPIWTISEVGKVSNFLASQVGKEECRRGNLHGYHMIAPSSHTDWKREVSIVSFREVWSLPLQFITRIAGTLGPRPRIRSPYREHLAQAFARYFMRVGLPADIPPFASAKEEQQVVKRFMSLDPSAQDRVRLEISKA